MMVSKGLAVTAIVSMAMAAGVHAPDGHAQDATVITITQTGCQFLEPEKGYDHGFEPTQAIDCVRINADTAGKRLAEAETLELKPGRYIFRVTNTDVPYELGFYAQAADKMKIPEKPRVAGGGVMPGETVDFAINLTAGEYVYACPLNPTPEYSLVVKP